MDRESTGSYLVRVIRVGRAANGEWRLSIDGPDGTRSVPLVPLTLVVRLWKSETGVLRGVLYLPGVDLSAPIQSNAGLEALARAYLEQAAGPARE